MARLLTASLAQRLGLEFHPVEVVERLIDKVAQRKALAAAGFEGPDFWTVPPEASGDETHTEEETHTEDEARRAEETQRADVAQRAQCVQEVVAAATYPVVSNRDRERPAATPTGRTTPGPWPTSWPPTAAKR
ncbi:MAG: hypothetical protein WB765_15275 [Acidimicrobiales bacterium]